MDRLLSVCEKKYSPEKVELIKRASEYAKAVHEGQKRESGEPYYIHPEAVALLLADMDMDAETVAWLLPLVTRLRENGISCEIYPDTTKLKKQFDYADRKQIPFLSINGSTEAAAGQVNIKNLASGEQKAFAAGDIDAILDFIR